MKNRIRKITAKKRRETGAEFGNKVRHRKTTSLGSPASPSGTICPLMAQTATFPPDLAMSVFTPRIRKPVATTSRTASRT
jgi:hypothetical protein